MAAMFEVYRDNAGHCRFRLKAATGVTLMESVIESYANGDTAAQGARAAWTAAQGAPIMRHDGPTAANDPQGDTAVNDPDEDSDVDE